MTRERYLELLTEGLFDELIEWLKSISGKAGEDLSNDIRYTAAIYSNYQRELRKGLISSNDRDIKWNQILDSLLHFEEVIPDKFFDPIHTTESDQGENTFSPGKQGQPETGTAHSSPPEKPTQPLKYRRYFFSVTGVLIIAVLLIYVFYRFNHKQEEAGIPVGADCNGVTLYAGANKDISIEEFLEYYRQLQSFPEEVNTLEQEYSILCSNSGGNLDSQAIKANRAKVFILQNQYLKMTEEEVEEILKKSD